MDAAEAFRQIDSYSRTRFCCFTAEFFPDRTERSHVICFRPTEALTGVDNYACKYLTIADDALRACVIQRALTPEVEELVKSGLKAFLESLKRET